MNRPRRRPALVVVLALSALLTAIVALAAIAPIQPAQAAFPGDNGRIAFERGGTIQTMRADGSKRRRVTRPKNWRSDLSPAFSPNGKRIAFVRDFFRGPRRDWKSRIYIVRTNGSHLHRLKPRRRPRLRYYYDPALSPSGRRIAFEGCRRVEDPPWPHLRCALFTIKTDGTRQRRLTTYRSWGANSNPTFSPNGRMIAFDGERGQAACDIYLMRADGTDVRALTNNVQAQCDTDPSFSPGGSEIAFASNYRGDALGQIFVMRADGTDVRQVTTDDRFELFEPSFSPNGRQIAFTVWDELEREGWIGVMRADGTERRRLVAGSQPDWGVRR